MIIVALLAQATARQPVLAFRVAARPLESGQNHCTGRGAYVRLAFEHCQRSGAGRKVGLERRVALGFARGGGKDERDMGTAAERSRYSLPVKRFVFALADEACKPATSRRSHAERFDRANSSS